MSATVPDDDEAYHGKDIYPETVFTYGNDSKRKEPGTVVSQTIRELGKALKSFSCYFCTYLDDCVVVEYVSSKHRGGVKTDQLIHRFREYKIVDDFKEELEKNKLFIYKKDPFINKNDKNHLDNWWYLEPISVGHAHMVRALPTGLFGRA